MEDSVRLQTRPTASRLTSAYDPSMPIRSREIRLAARPRGVPVPSDFELAEVELPRAVRRRGPRAERVRLGRPVHAGPDERREVLCAAVRARRADDRRRGRSSGRVAQRALARRHVGRARPRLARGRALRRTRDARRRSLARAGLDVARRARDDGPHRLRRDRRHRRGAGRRHRVRVRRSRRSREPRGPARASARRPGRRQRGDQEKVAWLLELGLDGAFDYHETPTREALRELAPDGIDVYFDNVGGETLEAAIGAMRLGAGSWRAARSPATTRPRLCPSRGTCSWS